MSEEAKQRAVQAMRRVVDSREPRKETAWGLAGDATGTLAPSGRAGRIYVRLYGHDNQLVEAINRVVNAGVNMPVEVEVLHKRGIATDYRVTGISQEMADLMYPDDDDTGFYLPKHATTHERKQGLNGSDSVNVYKRMLTELRADPQTTPNLTLKVSAGYYMTTAIGYYAGGNSAAFSPPTAAQRYDLLYLDTTASPIGLDIREGTPATPGFAIKPQPLINEVPIAWVRFDGGETTVTESRITDARVTIVTVMQGVQGDQGAQGDDGGGGHIHVYNENKSNECDGSKVLFITAQEFEEETLSIMLNGQVQVLGTDYDYVENEPDQFTMAVAPEVDDTLIIEYIPLMEV